MSSPSAVRSVLFEPTRHDASNFDCDNASLNNWIRHFADHARRSRTANTYVFAESGRVVAYYALTPHSTQREDVDPRVGRGSPVTIPTYLVAKFAADRSRQSQGVGAALLLDALARVLVASDIAPGRLISVDAVDEPAARFYERLGFVRSPRSSLTLHMKSSTAIRIVGNMPA